MAHIDPPGFSQPTSPLPLFSGPFARSRCSDSSKKSGRASKMFSEATYIWNNSPVSLTCTLQGPPEPHWFSLWYPILPSDCSLTFNSGKLLLLLASLKNMPMPGEALLSISRPNRPWKLALLSPQTISPNLQRDSSSPVP